MNMLWPQELLEHREGAPVWMASQVCDAWVHPLTLNSSTGSSYPFASHLLLH